MKKKKLTRKQSLVLLLLAAIGIAAIWIGTFIDEKNYWHNVESTMLGKNVCITSTGSLTRYEDASKTNGNGPRLEDSLIGTGTSIYRIDSRIVQKAQVGAKVQIKKVTTRWSFLWTHGRAVITDVDVLDDGLQKHCTN